MSWCTRLLQAQGLVWLQTVVHCDITGCVPSGAMQNSQAQRSAANAHGCFIVPSIHLSTPYKGEQSESMLTQPQVLSFVKEIAPSRVHCCHLRPPSRPLLENAVKLGNWVIWVLWPPAKELKRHLQARFCNAKFVSKGRQTPVTMLMFLNAEKCKMGKRGQDHGVVEGEGKRIYETFRRRPHFRDTDTSKTYLPREFLKF